MPRAASHGFARLLVALVLGVQSFSCRPLHAAGEGGEVVIAVAAYGSKAAPPTKTASSDRPGPVASLAEAIALARELRQNPSGAPAIAIELAPGIHRLERPVRLGPHDSGTAEKPLVIRASAEGNVVLRGSVEIVPEPGAVRGYAHLQPEAKARARLYRLPDRLAGVRHIDTARTPSPTYIDERFSPPTTAPNVGFEVFDAQGALRAARWPNEGWARIDGLGDGKTSFAASAPRIETWRGEADLWAAGYWFWHYSYERHRIASVEARTVTLATPFLFGLKPSARYHVYNALAELDVAGEWYRDAPRNVLVAWPRGAARDAGRLEVSIAESAILLYGASNVRIENLTIEHFVGDAIRVEGGRNVVIAGSTLRWTGLHGAAFIDSRDGGIVDSDITDTGEGGIVLAGGDRHTLAPGGLFVRNCRILRFARIALTNKPAVDLIGVGNIAAGNYIAQAPNMGVQMRGNDHLVERNEIADVVTDTTDAGALYAGGDWTSRGSTVRHNFIHDVLPRQPGFDVKGVYLDDFTSGIGVHGNVFLRVEQPIFLGGGRDNRIDTNVLAASQPAVHIDSRGLNWAKAFVQDPANGLRIRLSDMPVRSPAWRTRYPELARLLDDEPGAAKGNISRGNLILGGRSYHLEGNAEARHQTLGPDVTLAAMSEPERAGLVAALAKAQTAAEVGTLLAPHAALASAKTLPFAEMDRAAVAGPACRRAGMTVPGNAVAADRPCP